MKICYITPEFVTEDNFFGGLSNYLYRISKALVEEGHDVEVVVFSQKEPVNLIKDGIKVHRIKNGYWIPKIIQKISRCRLYKTAKALDFNWQIYRYLKKNVKNKKYDVLQFTTVYGGYMLIPMLLFRSKSVVRGSGYDPHVIEFHQRYYGKKATFDNKCFKLLHKLQLKMAKNVFVPSISLKNFFYEKLRLSKVAILPSPFYIDADKMDNSIYDTYLLNKTYLLYFGTLNIQKGIHILGEAMNKIFPKNNDIYLAVVGKDTSDFKHSSIREYIKSICKDYVDRFIFLEQIPHSKLYPIVNNAYAVIFPSFRETLSNAMLEAMGLGKVVIGTTGSSFDEVILDGENGFLVEPGNANALAEKINYILNLDKADLEEKGERAKKSIEKFHPKITVKNHLMHYRSIIDRKN